jgi:tRNA 2-selenouridine synthase SelU
MANPDKKKFVVAFFDEFRKKVARLLEIYSNHYSNEAFTLCFLF